MSATLLPPSAWRKARKISSSECPSSPPACPPRSRPQDHACRSKLNLSLARFLGFGSGPLFFGPAHQTIGDEPWRKVTTLQNAVHSIPASLPKKDSSRV